MQHSAHTVAFNQASPFEKRLFVLLRIQWLRKFLINPATRKREPLRRSAQNIRDHLVHLITAFINDLVPVHSPRILHLHLLATPLMKPFILLTLIQPLLCASALAQTHTLHLWPGQPPGPPALVDEKGERDLTKPDDKLIAGKPIIKLGNVSNPEMHVYLPDPGGGNGGAVAICPGGGFSILAWDLEGTEVAEWLNDLGFAAAVVKYRVPTREHGDALDDQRLAPMKALGPLMDTQRALSLLRARAEEWNLDPQRIGVMGFSAGGETAALAALHGDRRSYSKTDSNDDATCRADFAMLVYPGGLHDKESGGLRSHLPASKNSPPMFFAHAADDRVTCLSSTSLFTALKQADVPAELHIFAKGGHGYGIRQTEEPVTHWRDRAAEWLRSMRFTGQD